jgi:hypothetical protein
MLTRRNPHTPALARRGPARRIRLSLLVLVPMTLSSLMVLLSAAPAERAGASCSGAGAPHVISRYNGFGTLVAQEATVYPGSTCDGNAVYQGAILDPVSDGSCAYAYYLEPFQYYAAQGASCTTGAWAFYGYTDVYGANSVYVSPRPSYLSDLWTLSWGY